MQVAKITAKLRDAVPVCFMVEGKEEAQYKNIELPDAIKELEMRSFAFDVRPDGKINFHIELNAGTLPQPLPAPRPLNRRTAKNAAPVEEIPAEPAAEAIAAIEAANEPDSTDDGINEEPAENAEAQSETDTMEAAFNVTGERRKALVNAISAYMYEKPEYKAAPSFAYTVGSYTINKAGTLTGEHNPGLLSALAEQGFMAE